MAAGGDSWRCKSIQFKKRVGVAYWLSKAGDGSLSMPNPAKIAEGVWHREKWTSCGIGVSDAHCGGDGKTRGGIEMPSRESIRRGMRDLPSGG